MSLNELKPEDVMRALDILDKMYFFEGQRAGIELWFEKPFEVQEQDITDFSQGIAFLKNLVKDALALLRENGAEIERLTAQIEHCDACDRIGLTHSEHIVCIKQARAEAIDEFAERLKSKMDYVARWQMHGDKNEYFIIGKPFVDEIAKELKGEKE